MASIILTGTLLDPNSDLAVGDKIRFTHRTTTGETIKGAVSVETIDPSGTYTYELQYGLVMVEYRDIRSNSYKNLGVVTVNQDSTATSLPELLNAIVPPTDEQLLEFQAILADCVAEADRAEAAAQSVTGGVAVFFTYAELDAYTPTPEQERVSYKVTNDPDTSLNGYYSWVSGTTYTKDASLVQNVIEESNTSDAVSGKAVFDDQEEQSQQLEAISSQKALTFYSSIVDGKTDPQFERGDLGGDSGGVGATASGWRSPFTHDGTDFDSIILKLRDDGRKAEVMVSITDASFNLLARGTVTVESGVNYEQQLIVLNQYVRVPNGTVCYVEYLATDLTHNINQAKGSQYSPSDPDINAYREYYTADGEAWSLASPIGNYCISFKAFDSAVLLQDVNFIRSIEEFDNQSEKTELIDWAAGFKHYYGGDPLDDLFDTEYQRKGVGVQLTNTPEGLQFNSISMWGAVSGSTDVIVKVYTVPVSGFSTHIPNADGTPIAEITVNDWDSVLSKRKISFDQIYTIPSNVNLLCIIVPATGTGETTVARWTTDGGGGTYPLSPIKLVIPTSANGVDNFDEEWGDGSSSFLGVPPILEIVPDIQNAVTKDELIAGLATKVDKFIPRVTIPDTVVAVIGTELNIYYDGIVLGMGNGLQSTPEGLFVEIKADFGQAFERQFRVTPMVGDVGVHSATINVFDMFSRLLTTKTFNIEVINNAAPTSTKTIINIGDSLNSGAQVTTPIYDDFVALGGAIPVFEGSQGVSPKNHESYSGWTFNRFATEGELTHRFEVAGVTSVGVGDVYTNNGENYTVIEVNTTGGAGNINTTSASNIDPLASGVLTKSSGSGDAAITYTSFTEEAGNPLWNPNTMELDIAYYRGNLGVSVIDVVTIQLGINDSFSSTIKTQAQVDGNIADAKLIVDAFLTDNPNTNIIIGLPSTGGNTKDGYGSNYGANYSKIAYENNIYLLRESLISTFDLGAYSSNVHVGSAGLSIDRHYGYSMSPYPVASRITDVNINRHTNAVHPRQEGYNQIGDAYFAEILNLINN